MPKLTPLRVIVGAAVAGVLSLVAAGLVFFVALLVWGLPHFERSDLIGVYVAKYPTGTQTLTLNEDGNFLQEVKLKKPPDSAPFTQIGSWTWDESAQRLRMDNCWGVNDGLGNISPTFQTEAGRCDYPLTRRWWFFGQLLLGDEDSAPLRKVD
jgi:NlpE N-terminal domain